MSRHWQVQGTVAPGFEPVREAYELGMRRMAEENTQLCVYYRGERVVDLWASKTNDTSFSPDSLVNVFSSGKSLETIAIAWLVGQGRLDYKAKVAEYWPAFAANGKQDLTVADVMRHEGGMAAFDTSIPPEDLHAQRLKANPIGAIVERQTAKFRKDGKREYHAVTRGWIANEIFRRAEPNGRTMGEFLREEISGPLEADAVIGVKEEELGRISKVKMLGFLFHLLESLKPRALGRRVYHSFFQILGRFFQILRSFRHATTRGAPPPFVGMNAVDAFNDPAISMGETPSAGAKCSARGLGKIAAMMSAGGTWEGRHYLSGEAWKALHDEAVPASMGFPTNFTQGGLNHFTETTPQSSRIEREFNVGREGFYGWMGLGGSIFQWHPTHEIGFAFVPTSLHVIDILNERGKVYQAEVLRCVRRLEA